ncbi:hypothetical protein DL770_003745 [Monosporascus sp. CRB-9-2]|nr:hypothetical protein DL770_003745 [Monosporascus sp. CRB-9-2]
MTTARTRMWAVDLAKIEARVLLRELVRGAGDDSARLAIVSQGTFLLFLTEDYAALEGFGRPGRTPKSAHTGS